MRCFTLVRRLPVLDDVTDLESALSLEGWLEPPVDEPRDSSDDSRLPDRFLSSIAEAGSTKMVVS